MNHLEKRRFKFPSPKQSTSTPQASSVPYFSFVRTVATPDPQCIGDKGEERFILKTRHTRNADNGVSRICL